jgi:hypothetical protein
LREQGLERSFHEAMAIFAHLIREMFGIDHERYVLFCGMAIA